MKKQLKFILLAVMAVFSITFVSCGNDDDEPSENQIEINGTKYSVSLNYIMGTWIEVYEGVGVTTLHMNIPMGGFYGTYTFTGEASHEPKIGDDLSSMKDFEVGRDFFVVNRDEMADYTYSSGSAKVISTDKANSLITIQFSNLKMVYDGNSFVFNGTVKMPFMYQ